MIWLLGLTAMIVGSLALFGLLGWVLGSIVCWLEERSAKR